MSREIAENTAAGQDVGAAVTATDADAGDTLSYTLGGADVAAFDFVETTGQIRTKAGVSYDFEAKASYTVTVTATDNSNATAVADVTISISDVDEPPSAPATPMVSAVSGSTTSLSVSWAAPANAGKPAIASYDVQYRVGSSGTWSDGPQDVTGTTTTVSGLVADTLYEARVRASNAEGDSGWSEPPGSGRTNAPSNNAPVFSPAMPEREIAENTAAGQDVGAAVTATDADAGDTLSYTLGGADVASFDFVETTGQIRTKAGVSYDHEAKASYTVTVTATDNSNATAVADVTISISDVDEPPSAPATPMVSAVSGSTTSLSVSWAAPANAGKPAIASYDLQYRVGSSGTWSDGPVDVAGTSTTITSLVANTDYEARVRASNAEGDSGWSEPPGSGRTNAPSNNAPVFSSSNVSREIAENTAAGQDVGAAVTATDADAGDTLSYTLGGADVASFDFVETTGQIRTKAGVSYDFEAKASYTVTVTATDNSNATAVAERHDQRHRRGRAPQCAGDAHGLGSLRQHHQPVGQLGRPGQRRQARHRQLRRAVPRGQLRDLERRPGGRRGHDHDHCQPRRGHRSMRRGCAPPTPRATPAGPSRPGPAGPTRRATMRRCSVRRTCPSAKSRRTPPRARTSAPR